MKICIFISFHSCYVSVLCKALSGQGYKVDLLNRQCMEEVRVVSFTHRPLHSPPAAHCIGHEVGRRADRSCSAEEEPLSVLEAGPSATIPALCKVSSPLVTLAISKAIVLSIV